MPPTLYAGFLRKDGNPLELFCVGDFNCAIEKCKRVVSEDFYTSDETAAQVVDVMYESDHSVFAYLVPLSLSNVDFVLWHIKAGGLCFKLDWAYNSNGGLVSTQGYVKLIRHAKWLSTLQKKLLPE